MKSLTQEDLIRVLLKKWWWTAVSIVACLSLAYGGWKIFPKTYKSTVIVTIDSPKVSKHIPLHQEDGGGDVCSQPDIDTTGKSPG